MSHLLAAAVAVALALTTPVAAEEGAAEAEPAAVTAPAGERQPAAEAKPEDEKKPAEEKKPRVVTYRDDKLTLRVDKAPAREVLDEVARQSKADIRGDVPEDAVVSADFEDVPLTEAMERVFGKQNFTLGYDEAGRLVRITLLGGPLPPPEKPAPGAEHAAEQAESGQVQQEERPWPRDEHVKQAADKAWKFMSDGKQYAIDGRLAEALGTDRATFRQLAFAAAREPDADVRALGLRASIDAIRADPEVRNAFMAALMDLPDEAVARLARQFAQEQAEEFVRRAARQSRERELRARMPGILEQLNGMGPDK